MSFTPVLIICVLAGLGFAAGAYLTAAKAGVALQLGSQQPALTIGYRGFSVSSGNALVGLIICSLFCMTLVPIALLVVDWKIQQLARTMVIEANFTPSVPLIIRSTADNDFGTYDVKLRIFKSGEAQGFQLSNKDYSPVVITTTYDWLQNKIVGEINGSEVPIVIVGDSSARFTQKFALVPTVQAQPSVPPVLSSAPPVQRLLSKKPDPGGT